MGEIFFIRSFDCHDLGRRRLAVCYGTDRMVYTVATTYEIGRWFGKKHMRQRKKKPWQAHVAGNTDDMDLGRERERASGIFFSLFPFSPLLTFVDWLRNYCPFRYDLLLVFQRLQNIE
jgi:hypothetical protein